MTARWWKTVRNRDKRGKERAGGLLLAGYISSGLTGGVGHVFEWVKLVRRIHRHGRLVFNHMWRLYGRRLRGKQRKRAVIDLISDTHRRLHQAINTGGYIDMLGLSATP